MRRFPRTMPFPVLTILGECTGFNKSETKFETPINAADAPNPRRPKIVSVERMPVQPGTTN